MIVESLGRPSTRDDRIINVEPEVALSNEMAVQVSAESLLPLAGWLSSEVTWTVLKRDSN